MSDPLKPGLSLLCKLGSIAVHAQELFEPKGHVFDREAMLSVLGDVEVQQWIKDMGVYMPVRRG
jgi:hypothetical protein